MRKEDIRGAEKEQKRKQTKSPFIRYCTTATTCLLIAATGFMFVFYARGDDIITERRWTSSDIVTYITTNTTTTTISKDDDDDDDDGSSDPVLDYENGGSSSDGSLPVLPGVGGITLGGSSYMPLTITSSTGSTDYNPAGGNALSLYNGWPWGGSSTVTMVNPVAMIEQWASDVAQSAGVSKTNVRYSTKASIDTDKYCSASFIDVDGISCLPLCFYPAWVDEDYYAESWAGNMPSWSSSMADSIYACIVVEDSEGNNWFLPVAQSDNKGHTFPGGVCQTWMKQTSNVGGEYQVQLANNITNSGGNSIGTSNETGLKYISGSVGSGDGAVWQGYMSQFLNLYNDTSGYELHYKSGGGNGKCTAHFSLEVNGANKDNLKALLNEYKFIGIATMPK